MIIQIFPRHEELEQKVNECNSTFENPVEFLRCQLKMLQNMQTESRHKCILGIQPKDQKDAEWMDPLLASLDSDECPFWKLLELSRHVIMHAQMSKTGLYGIPGQEMMILTSVCRCFGGVKEARNYFHNLLYDDDDPQDPWMKMEVGLDDLRDITLNALELMQICYQCSRLRQTVVAVYDINLNQFKCQPKNNKAKLTLESLLRKYLKKAGNCVKFHSPFMHVQCLKTTICHKIRFQYDRGEIAMLGEQMRLLIAFAETYSEKASICEKLEECYSFMMKLVEMPTKEHKWR
jgi:hypothetical protein